MLLPNDVDGTIAAATPVRQQLMRANVALVGSPFALPPGSTLGPDALLALILRYKGEASNV